MTITRRRVLSTGLAVVAGAAGLTEAARLASRYGLVPPDGGGIYGPGETLDYAAANTIGRHTLAREFPRSMISEKPFANEMPPLGALFETRRAAGFDNWKLAVDGMVAHPAEFSVGDLRGMPQRSQITEVACEEGWSYIAEWTGTPLREVLREVRRCPEPASPCISQRSAASGTASTSQRRCIRRRC